MLWLTLQAVAELGGSASIGESVETVIKREGFSDAQWHVAEDDPDSDLYAESSEADAVISYIMAHA